jgi:hypothetical protein
MEGETEQAAARIAQSTSPYVLMNYQIRPIGSENEYH